MRYSIEPRTRNYFKGYGLLQEISQANMGKINGSATEAGIDAAETTSKNIVNKTNKAMGELIGNIIADKIVKPNPVK